MTTERDAVGEPSARQPAAVIDAEVDRPNQTAHDETPYLQDQTVHQARDQWRRIQAEFVDDPRKSVGEAHELVGDLVQRIVDAFTQERNDLERQWSEGDNVSTEELRVCLQRYRAFFSRLLPSMDAH